MIYFQIINCIFQVGVVDVSNVMTTGTHLMSLKFTVVEQAVKIGKEVSAMEVAPYSVSSRTTFLLHMLLHVHVQHVAMMSQWYVYIKADFISKILLHKTLSGWRASL